mgnify:CR=1 FL=1
MPRPLLHEATLVGKGLFLPWRLSCGGCRRQSFLHVDEASAGVLPPTERLRSVEVIGLFQEMRSTATAQTVRLDPISRHPEGIHNLVDTALKSRLFPRYKQSNMRQVAEAKLTHLRQRLIRQGAPS